jgi:tight adherence protein B
MIQAIPISETAVLYAVLFLALLLVGEGLYRFFVDLRYGPRSHINRRMELLDQSGGDARDVLRRLRRDPAERSLVQRLVPLHATFERLAVEGGLGISVGQIWLLILGLGIALFAVSSLLSTAPMPALAVAAAAIAVLPVMLYLTRRRTLRLRRLEEQLPDALDLLVRSLRAGHPMSAALDVVATEMSDPVGTEFGIVVDEITYGLEVPAALERLSQRIDVPDLRYFTVVVNIQYESGGNLAEILTALSKVIRERFHLFSKVKALTADARFSAWYLSLFPIVMCFVIQMVTPTFYTSVADHPLFKPLVVLTFVLLLLNILVMRQLTNFKA